MDKCSRIYVSGHSGMVGGAVVESLKENGYINIILRRHQELDLKDKAQVDDFMKEERPEYVFLFAAKVGGIKANISYPSAFLYDNLMIASNLISASYQFKVRKLLYLGSSCIYPRKCSQPMREECLLTGKLEPTNEGYALAKIVGLKLCEYFNKEFSTNFISLMPPNLYGPRDNFDLDSSHVIAGLIRKFLEAKNGNVSAVEVWGTGEARREFLYIEDLADACMYFMNNFDAKDLPAFLNIGSGGDISIKELASLIKDKVGYLGKIKWNTSMPDGMPQKFLDMTLAKKFGWRAETLLEEGLKKTIDWYVKHRRDS